MNRILIVISLLLLIWTSSATAQDITPTDPPSPTASTTPLPTITLTLFRDADSLTLLVPASSLRVSLVGLEYRVTLLDGQTIIRRLDRDFASFFGLPFDQISVIGAVCFRLVKSSTIGPVPIECTNGPTLFTQQLAAADGFWHDPGIGVGRVVMLMQDGTFVGLCPAEQSACTLTFALRPTTPTPTPSVTPIVAKATANHITTASNGAVQPIVTAIPVYPCEGAIIFGTGANQVKITPLRAAPNQLPVQQGATVKILAARNSDGTNWYQIRYTTTGGLQPYSTGWITADLIEPSASCPK